MSKRELAQILEQQEWHDRTRWNEDGTPSSEARVAGGEGKERKKRRRVFAEEEEEEEKEEKPASPQTFLKEEEYFDAGEEEEDDDDDDDDEDDDDESAKLLREIATSLRALETKVDALIVARSTEKNSKKKKC